MGKMFANRGGTKVFSATVGEADLFSNQYQDEILTNYSKAYMNKGDFLWNKIFDSTPVKQPKGDVYSYGKQAMRLVDQEVGYRGGLNKVEIEAVRNQEWDLRSYGLYAEILVSDVKNADSPLDAKTDNSEIVMEMVKLGLENRAMKVFDNTLGLTTVVEVSEAGDKLDNAASDPFLIVKSAVNTVKQQSGKRLNNMAVTRDVAMALSVHPKVLARLQQTTAITQGMMEAALGGIFNMTFHIAETQKFTGVDSFASGNLTFLTSGKIFFRYSDGSPKQKSLSFGKAYNRTNGTQSFMVDSHPTDVIKNGVSGIVATQVENDLVIASSDCGILYYNVLANPTT